MIQLTFWTRLRHVLITTLATLVVPHALRHSLPEHPDLAIEPRPHMGVTGFACTTSNGCGSCGIDAWTR